MSVMRVTAAGDGMIFRRLPGEYPGFAEVRDFLARGDLRFLNLETTVHRHETFGAAVSGGSWFCTDPEILKDVRAFGFNALSTANNHAMDYSHAGLLKTLEYIRGAGLAVAGTGASLSEAAAPAYVDTPAGRFALIGACSSFHPDAIAGNPARGVPARPGLNAIRYNTVYRLPEEELAQLERIADDIMINAAGNNERAQGYAPPIPEGQAAFGKLRFERADAPSKRTSVDERDMRRVEASIREALFMADCVLVAMHSHEIPALSKEEARAIVETYSAPPGTSEHQTGLCADMHNVYNRPDLELEDFEKTDAYLWLRDNCWKFGFILRFPRGKEEITGYQFECWHFRFVGRYHAKRIFDSGLCLEEYLEKLNKN